MNQDAVNKPSLKERLSRLEHELDQLISIQEKSHETQQPSPCEPQQQRCPCLRIPFAARTRMCALFNTRLSTYHSSSENTLPISEITKFLQNINLNINRGAQAITKIANATSQPVPESGKPLLHKNCFQQDNQNKLDFPSVCKIPGGRGLNEDALFKELREEKDKRLRADNQIKILKEELRKFKCEIQEKADLTVNLLKAELRDTTERWNKDKYELEKISKEHQACEYLWPLKYESLTRELNEERSKRENSEKNVQRLDNLLQNRHSSTEDYLSLKGTANWLKEQNKNLTHLTNKLQHEIEENILELHRKDQKAEESLKKIKQLTCICQKLRDQLIIMRDKLTAGAEKLGENFVHAQKLADKLLEEQSKSEELRKLLEQDGETIIRLNEQIKEFSTSNINLQARVDEITEIMRQQDSLAARQSETINIKDEQLKLAYENMKLKDERFEHLKKAASDLHEDKDYNKLNKIRLDLEKEKEMNLIQEKVIENHLMTISQYKNELAKQDSEINQLKREASDRAQKLSIEQTTNEQLLTKIKMLKNHKEDLKIKVEELEDQLESQQLTSEHTKRLELIENQVREKQKDWEDQKKRLILDREEALNKLRCTVQKLAAEQSEWQMEKTTQQDLTESLNHELREKGDLLQAALDKNESLERELEEAREAARKTKESFDQKLQNACKAWQGALIMLQN